MENTKENTPQRHFRMLTKQELHDTAIERVEHISKEFTVGFDFLRDYPKSITVFGGTHFTEENPYYGYARTLGERVVKELGYSVFTGGGPGIMEAANRGAFEAGGKSLGLTIQLTNQIGHNAYLTHHLDFYYFFSRKVCLTFSAEAYIFFPGGYGTVNEFFEILTLIQTGKIEKMPMILFGSEFWNGLDSFIKAQMITRGTVEPDDINLYTITDDLSHVIEMIKSAPVRNGIEIKHFHHLEETPSA